MPRRGSDTGRTVRRSSSGVLGSAAPLLVLGALSAGCAAGWAERVPDEARLRAPPTAYREALALTIENDSILGTDVNYSNGAGLTWISRERSTYPEDSLRGRWLALGSLFPFVDAEGQRRFAALTLGQEMFTPEDPSRGPFEVQRPYAGVLYLDSTFLALRRGATHSWNLRLGLVGPSAMAEEVQGVVHRAMGVVVRDWSDQLPDEPIANLDYDVAFRLLEGRGEDGTEWRIVPVATASLGTYFTGAGLGAYGELGWNLPEALGLVSVRRGLEPFTTIGGVARSPWSLSLVGGGGVFAVGHYLPLDGTVFRDSDSVETKPFVGFATGGLALRRGPWSFGVLLTTLTDSFEGQPSRETFGTFTLKWSM